MVQVEAKTNLGFFFIFLGLILVAFIEGNQLVSAIGGESFLTGSDIHLVSFVILTLFMLIVALFKPHKQILVTFSAVTLSLIIILTTFFDSSFQQIRINMIIYLLSAIILLIGGILIAMASRLTFAEKEIVNKALLNYKR